MYRVTKEPQWIERAKLASQEALAIEGSLPEVHMALGDIFVDTGQLSGAADAFGRAIELEPKNSDAVRRLADVYLAEGNNDAAERTYRKAIALNPEHWAGHSFFGVFLLRNGRYAEAAEQFEKVIDLTPANMRAHSNLGTAYFAMGDCDSAIIAFRLSLAIKPTYFAYSNLGTIFYFQGKYVDAMREMESAMELRKSDYRSWANLADARYWVEGSKAQAAAAYLEAIALAKKELGSIPTTLRYLAA